MERQWLSGCPCHEEECIAFARKGEVFKCPENRKSKRGPEIRQRLARAQERWRHNQACSRLSSEDDPDSEIYAGVHSAYSHLAGLTTPKLSFVNVAPWRLWEARDRAQAHTLLSSYREEVAVGKKQHRVSEYYMDESTELGADFARWADHGLMSDFLSYELSALEHAQFDGGSGEGIHRDMHRIALCATGSTFRYQCATLRLEQNLGEYDLMCSLGMADKFCIFWNMHRAVLQRNVHRQGKKLSQPLMRCRFLLGTIAPLRRTAHGRLECPW